MDETYQVAITRLGDRVRIGGMAELAGYDLALRQAPRRTLEHVLRDLFPSAGDVAERELLVRPAADDAGRPADPRPDALPQPLAQHRARHARLDHGLRLRPGRRGPDLGPDARAST